MASSPAPLPSLPSMTLPSDYGCAKGVCPSPVVAPGVDPYTGHGVTGYMHGFLVWPGYRLEEKGGRRVVHRALRCRCTCNCEALPHPALLRAINTTGLW